MLTNGTVKRDLVSRRLNRLRSCTDFVKEQDAKYVGVYKRYMATDCPACGAQIRMGVRLPREDPEIDF